LVNGTILRAADDDADIRNFGGMLLTEQSGGAVEPLNPGIIVDPLTVLDALPKSPRIRRLERRLRDLGFRGAFHGLMKKRLKLMIQSFLRHSGELARDGWPDSKVRRIAFCEVGQLAETLQHFIAPAARR
jgi:hypothetical protein